MLVGYCCLLVGRCDVDSIKSAFRLDALDVSRSDLGEVKCLCVRRLSCSPDVLYRRDHQTHGQTHLEVRRRSTCLCQYLRQIRNLRRIHPPRVRVDGREYDLVGMFVRARSE